MTMFVLAGGLPCPFLNHLCSYQHTSNIYVGWGGWVGGVFKDVVVGHVEHTWNIWVGWVGGWGGWGGVLKMLWLRTLNITEHNLTELDLTTGHAMHRHYFG